MGVGGDSGPTELQKEQQVEAMDTGCGVVDTTEPHRLGIGLRFRHTEQDKGSACHVTCHCGIYEGPWLCWPCTGYVVVVEAGSLGPV